MRGKWLIALVAVLAVARSASATVPSGNVDLFDTYGLGVDESEGYTVSGADSPVDEYFASAADFSPSVTANLQSITLAFALVSGPDSFTYDLDTDNAGLPGATLESWNQGAGGAFGGPVQVTLDSVLHPLLTAGDNYWIAIFPGTSTSWGAWDLTNGLAVDPIYSNDAGSTWVDNGSIAPAFSVEGTTAAVPTPAALPGGVALLVGLLGYKRFARKAAAN